MEPERTPNLPLQILHLRNIRHAVGQIPKNVQRQRRRRAGEPVHLGRVGELLLDGGSGGGLHKLAKARAGVGESPGGNLDLEESRALNCQIACADSNDNFMLLAVLLHFRADSVTASLHCPLPLFTAPCPAPGSHAKNAVHARP
jgi:hypothetical protein